MVLYPEPADPDHFRDYSDVTAPQGEAPYFAIFGAEFTDTAAMSAAREPPQGGRVSADVAN